MIRVSNGRKAFSTCFRRYSTGVERYKVARHQVSRRILLMNKRKEKEFGEPIAKQRGWHWTQTNFAAETWDKNKIEVKEDLKWSRKE